VQTPLPGENLGRSAQSKIEVDADLVKSLAFTGKEEAFELLAALVEVSPAAVAAFQQMIQSQPQLLSDERILRTVGSFVDLVPSLLDKEDLARQTITMTRAILESDDVSKEKVRSAVELLALAADSHSTAVLASLRNSKGLFRLSTSSLTRELALRGTTGAKEVLRHLVDIGLRHVVRVCSDDRPLAGDEIEKIKNLRKITRVVFKMASDTHR
jgi:hypothetical protein